jgi:hypothetical protein
MLYDPKWEQPTKVDPFSLEAITAWLGRQDPATEYDYWTADCVVCRYLNAEGISLRKYFDVLDCRERLDLFGTRPWTLGAAFKRAQERLTTGQRAND